MALSSARGPGRELGVEPISIVGSDSCDEAPEENRASVRTPAKAPRAESKLDMGMTFFARQSRGQIGEDKANEELAPRTASRE